jgi:hypothetical protein
MENCCHEKWLWERVLNPEAAEQETGVLPPDSGVDRKCAVGVFHNIRELCNNIILFIYIFRFILSQSNINTLFVTLNEAE